MAARLPLSGLRTARHAADTAAFEAPPHAGEEKFQVFKRNAAKLSTFADEWNDHRNDAALYRLFRSLRAHYMSLDNCMSTLNMACQALFENFELVPRGSYSRALALRGTADLDVDLILSRAVYTAEEMKQKCVVNGVVDVRPFGQLCKRILYRMERLLDEKIDVDVEVDTSSSLDTEVTYSKRRTLRNDGIDEEDEADHRLENATVDLTDLDGRIRASVDLPKLPGSLRSRALGSGEKITRSIKFEMVLQGSKIDIDIFPKLIDNDGAVCCLSQERNDGIREWLCQPTVMRRQAKIELTEEEEAALLLVKLWKKDLPEPVKNTLKGYHLALAIERIHIDEAAAKEPPPALTPAQEKEIAELGEEIEFKRTNVAALICLLAEYLHYGYSTANPGSRYTFVTAGNNPFYSDSKPENRLAICTALKNLQQIAIPLS